MEVEYGMVLSSTGMEVGLHFNWARDCFSAILAPIVDELQRRSGMDISFVTRVRRLFLCVYYRY
jgi:hypothetical protein